MLRWFYSGVMTGVAPLALAWFYYRGRKDAGYRAHLWERLGRLEVTDTEQNGLLIHTVSVGETIAARQLIQQAIEEFPHSPITISCMTPTARRLLAYRSPLCSAKLPVEAQTARDLGDGN